MKIDIISALFGRPGGAENATRILAEALVSQGADVRVVGTRRAGRAYPYARVLDGVEQIPTNALLYAWNPILDNYLASKLFAYLVDRRPDIVLLEDHMLFRAAIMAVRRYRKRIGKIHLAMTQIWDVDTSYWFEFRPFPIAWWMHRHFSSLNRLARQMDLVNAVIPFHKTELVRLFGVDPERIITAQTTAVRPQHGERNLPLNRKATFVAPGRINPEKGSLFVLEAVQELLRLSTNFLLVYYGTGPSEQQLRDEIVKRKLQSHVEVRGAISNDRLLAEISNSDAVCVPIMYPPGYTCVALESLSVGVPLIAFDHGGVPDLIDDGVTGFKVAPRSATAYARAMKAFIDDPVLSLSMDPACRRKATAIASPETGAKDLYNEFVSRFGGTN